MPELRLPPIETLDVEDLVSLPRGYGYELHEGCLIISPPSNFWHKAVVGRLLAMLSRAGLRAFYSPGVLGDKPRDNRIPDVGVVTSLPPCPADYANLPGSFFRTVVEIVSPESATRDYHEKARWYAERGIPEYWIVDQTPELSDDDALVHLHRLTMGGSAPAYGRERSMRLSELEAEYRPKDE